MEVNIATMVIGVITMALRLFMFEIAAGESARSSRFIPEAKEGMKCQH